MCVKEINNSRPRDLNLFFTIKTSGREEDSWWDTFESQDVSSMMSFSLTHTVSEDTHCLTVSEDTHCLTVSEDTHCLWGHTLSLRTHTISLSLRTHTVSEDTHCLTVSEDTHFLTVSEDTHYFTVSEDTHCLWGHTLWWTPLTSLLNRNTWTCLQEADWVHLVCLVTGWVWRDWDVLGELEINWTNQTLI